MCIDLFPSSLSVGDPLMCGEGVSHRLNVRQGLNKDRGGKKETTTVKDACFWILEDTYESHVFIC